MRRSDPAPQGLVGAGSRQAIGVQLNTAIKSERGVPIYKGRYWLMSHTTESKNFGKYSSPTRSPHAAFAVWNEAAKALGNEVPPGGAGRVGIIRGNLLWARMRDSARWSRVAQKGQAGTPAPPSRRPWCEGDGRVAKRFAGMRGDDEQFDVIACPNEDCPIALARLCKPAAHLLFRLRWNESDLWQAQFQSMICEFKTGSWGTLANLRGLFELVLGTEAILTPEEVAISTAEDRERWKPGLAAEFGITEPSLVGLPFVMVIGARTSPPKPGEAHGSRYYVSSFSFDGDPAEWLLSQRRTRLELQGAPERLMLPSVQEPFFEQVERHDSRVEILPDYVEAPAESLLAPEEVAELRRLCGELGASWDAVEERLGGPVAEMLGPSRDSLRRRVRDAIEALAPQEG